MTRIVVLGCGYVGLELGRRLAADGDEVVGVRRSDEGLEAVRDAGLDPVHADVTDADSLAEVPDADHVVFAVSSGGRGAAAAREVYVEGLRTVVETVAARESPPDRLVYASSTGVYGDHGGDWVDEETPLRPETDRAEALVEAERVALDETADRGIDGTVARLAGLYGPPDRYRLDHYLEGPVTEGYLNMVHRDDAAGAVAHLLREDVARGEVVLVADDEPVDKWEFADWLARECGEDSPPKRTLEERRETADPGTRAYVLSQKRCSNDYLRSLGYEFDYPTYREGYRDAIERYRESSPS